MGMCESWISSAPQNWLVTAELLSGSLTKQTSNQPFLWAFWMKLSSLKVLHSGNGGWTCAYFRWHLLLSSFWWLRHVSVSSPFPPPVTCGKVVLSRWRNSAQTLWSTSLVLQVFSVRAEGLSVEVLSEGTLHCSWPRPGLSALGGGGRMSVRLVLLVFQMMSLDSRLFILTEETLSNQIFVHAVL